MQAAATPERRRARKDMLAGLGRGRRRRGRGGRSRLGRGRGGRSGLGGGGRLRRGRRSLGGRTRTRLGGRRRRCGGLHGRGGGSGGGRDRFRRHGGAGVGQGAVGGEALGQALGQTLGLLRRHLGEDGGQRPLLHLRGDRQAHGVFEQGEAGGGVLGFHRREHRDQPAHLGLGLRVSLTEQALDLALQRRQRLDPGVELGFGGGKQLQLHVHA